MFGSKKRSEFDVDSIIGKNTKIYGNLVFSGGLHIDGTIVGNVIAETEGSRVIISERGRIEGDVSVHHIQLNGEVIGDVHALKHIELATNARVKGNVYYCVIEMAKGAEVNGSLIHGEPVRQETVPLENHAPMAAEATHAPAVSNAAPTSPSQTVHSGIVNSMPNVAPPAHANHAAPATPPGPAVVSAATPPQQLQPVDSRSVPESPAPAVGHIKIANQRNG